MPETHRHFLSVELAVGSDGKLPTEFKMFSAGLNQSTKGNFMFTEASGKSCLDFSEKLGRDQVIDYEHASYSAKYASDPRAAGRAAGFCRLSVKERELWAANVSWSADGEDDLKTRRYRFFSPMFEVSEGGEILSVINCALTNNPALMGIKPLMASTHPEVEETPAMKTLLAMLSLKENASEAEAVTALSTRVKDHEQLLVACSAASVSEAIGKIQGWKTAAEQNAALVSKLAAVELSEKKAGVKALIETAKAEGKVSPAEVEFLSAMGEANFEQLKGFLAVKPKVLPSASKEPPGGANTGSIATLSQEEVAVAKQMGHDLKKLAEHKSAHGTDIPVVDVTKRAEA